MHVSKHRTVTTVICWLGERCSCSDSLLKCPDAFIAYWSRKCASFACTSGHFTHSGYCGLIYYCFKPITIQYLNTWLEKVVESCLYCVCNTVTAYRRKLIVFFLVICLLFAFFQTAARVVGRTEAGDEEETEEEDVVVKDIVVTWD